MKWKSIFIFFFVNFFLEIEPANTFYLDTAEIGRKQRCAWLVNGESGDYFHDWKKDKAKYMTPEDRCLLKIKDDRWNDPKCKIKQLFICTNATD